MTYWTTGDDDESWVEKGKNMVDHVCQSNLSHCSAVVVTDGQGVRCIVLSQQSRGLRSFVSLQGFLPWPWSSSRQKERHGGGREREGMRGMGGTDGGCRERGWMSERERERTEGKCGL